MTNQTELIAELVKALEQAKRVLDNVHLDIMIRDGMPAKGLLDALKMAPAALTKARAALAQTQGEPDLSALSPKTQDRIRAWLSDGTFVERAIGALQEQERELMAYEKSNPKSSEPAPMQFLCDGTRFKVRQSDGDEAARIYGLPSELNGRWVALVAADDDCHLAPSTAGDAEMATYPARCPITRRPFFMTLAHPELGLVPTYGGPYDSYTIPHMLGDPSEQMHERELEVHRYDHDLGSWVDDETIPLRVIHDDFLPSDEPAPTTRPATREEKIMRPGVYEVKKARD